MIYTEEMHQYILEIAPGRLNSEIADLFNIRFGTSLSAKTIKSYKSNHKIRSGKSNIDYSKKNYYNQLLNEEQVEYLKSIYLGKSNRECTKLMNEKFGIDLTCTQLKGQKRRFKLHSGIDGRFKKGQTAPSNCFKKGERVSVETEFKKGHVPKNWVPVGTEKVRSDGYTYVKISDIRGIKYSHIVNWKAKHILLWEENNGPVPSDSTLIFLDGNAANIALDNLECVTKSVRLILNKRKLIYADPELTKLGINVAKLIDATNKKNNVKKS